MSASPATKALTLHSHFPCAPLYHAGNVPGTPTTLPNLLPPPIQGPRGPVLRHRDEEEHIHVPENALQAIMHGITNLMGGNRDHHHDRQQGLFHLPQLPPGGLPLPLRALSNLLGVLPRPDLSGVLRMLPRNPLTGLIGGLPLALQEE